MDKITPLYQTHVDAGGKIVPFAGYLLPVEYGTGLIKEHLAVRTAAGLFDVSHMGEVTYTGKDALANINHLLCNDFNGMYDGRARYSPMLNENGGIVDDLIVYKLGDERYFVVVNASNREKDVEHMKKQLFGDVKFEDISDTVAQIALQGPRSHEIISKLASATDIPEKYYSCRENVKVAGINCILSKTGYTGEDGYELYLSPSDAVDMWNALIEAGAEYGLIPCGLGARDTLRTEAAMPLYGHEMNDEISPLETGLNFAVKMTKDEFIGRDALIKRGEPSVCRVGLRAVDRGVMREHQDVYADGVKIGHTTSGTFSPLFKVSVAMAIIDKKYADIGSTVSVDVRGRMLKAEVVPLPFYKKQK